MPRKRKPLKLLTVPKERSDEDFADSERTRREIANRQLRDYLEACSIMGIGHRRYWYWRMVDRSGRLEPQRIYGCCRQDGQIVHQEDPEGERWMERLGPPFEAYYLGGKHADQPGEFGFRWMQCFTSIQLYHPSNADELRTAHEKRRAKAIAENERRLQADAEWKRRNETPSLFPVESE